jgi:hypothetical protein
VRGGVVLPQTDFGADAALPRIELEQIVQGMPTGDPRVDQVPGDKAGKNAAG